MTEPRKASTVLVLDSTEITADWLLRSASLRIARSVPDLKIAVPASVLLEVKANRAREAKRSQVAIRRALRDHHRLGFPPQPFRERESDYDRQLQSALERIHATVLPWPDASHEEITRRAVGRNPPFDSKGSGYRDTLVWLAALQVAREGHDVVLVSRDRDFSDQGGELAMELANEAEQCSGSVRLVQDLRKWLTDQATVSIGTPTDSERADMRDAQFFDEFLGPWDFEDAWLTPEEVGLPDDASSSYIVGTDYLSDIRRTTTNSLIDGGTFVQWEAEMLLELETTVPPDFALALGWIEKRGDAGVDVKVALPVTTRFNLYYDADDNGLDVDSIEYHRSGPLKLIEIQSSAN